MKEGWSRSSLKPRLSLNTTEAAKLFQPLKGDCGKIQVENLSLLEGGFSNSNYRVELKDEIFGRRLFVLRLLEHGTLSDLHKEEKLNQMLRATVPMPEFYLATDDNDVFSSVPYIIMEYVQGESLEQLKDLGKDEALSLAKNLGETLAALHKIRFASQGFLDENLLVSKVVEINGQGLRRFAESTLLEKGRAAILGKSLTRRFLAFLEQEADLLDDYKELACLCHSDFGSSNLLIAGKPAPQVVAVLDFEFAFSGTPYVDLGNLLRPPFSQEKAVREAVFQGYRNAGGKLGDRDIYQKCLLTDLFAWLEFLSREEVPEPVLASVRNRISATMADWLFL